jgi:putative FmdB family regulatory protein
MEPVLDLSARSLTLPRSRPLPIYEYRCDACGHTVEVFQKFSDDPLETCEVCGGHLSKVLHPVAIHFKGSGFYTTDYGRGSGKARSAGEAAKAADEADKKADQAKGAEAPAAKATGDGAGAAKKSDGAGGGGDAAASRSSTNHKTG